MNKALQDFLWGFFMALTKISGGLLKWSRKGVQQAMGAALVFES